MLALLVRYQLFSQNWEISLTALKCRNISSINRQYIDIPETGHVRDFLRCIVEANGERVGYRKIEDAIGTFDYNDVHKAASNTWKWMSDCLKIDRKEAKEIIVNVRGVGYRFVPKGLVKEKEDDILEAEEYNEFMGVVQQYGISGRMGREQVFALANRQRPNKYAALELAELYFYDYLSLTDQQPDFRNACKYYRIAGNHPVAKWTLGYCIIKNLEPQVSNDADIDYGKAKEYFIEALQSVSGVDYSDCYSAQALYEKLKNSKDRIYPMAVVSIGELCENGHFPKRCFDTTKEFESKNIKLAQDFFLLAAEQGYHYAMNRVALYSDRQARKMGNACDQQLCKTAFEWFFKSNKSVPSGYTSNMVGRYFEEGFGTQKKPDEACKYYLASVEDVLPDDRTEWGYFNASRVYAGLIPNQPTAFRINLEKAKEYFDQAYKKIEKSGDRNRILIEMFKVFDLSGKKISPESMERFRDWLLSKAELFCANEPLGPNNEELLKRIKYAKELCFSKNVLRIEKK